MPLQEAESPRLTPAAPIGNFRALGAWYAVEFLNSYAATLLTAGCYDYAHRVLKATASTELWLSAGWGFAYIFIALWAGKIAEKWGPRRSVLVMSAGSVLTAGAGLLAIAWPSVWTLLLIMLGYNITCTTIWPAIESGLSRTRVTGMDGGGMGLSARMALFNISWGSAGFAAFFTRGALENASWCWVFAAPAIAHAIAWIIMKTRGVSAAMIGHAQVEDSAHARPTDDARVPPERAKTLLHMAWLANAMAYVAIYVLIPLLSKLAQAADTGSLVAAGMITSAWSFARFAGFGLTWLWTSWHYRARWLLGAMVLLAGSFFVTLTVHHSPAVLVTAQILFGLATAVIYSSALYYAMHVSHGGGSHAGMHEALIGVGVFVGPTIGALAGAGEIGEAAMWRIGVGVTGLLAAGVIAMMVMNGKKVEQPKTKDDM